MLKLVVCGTIMVVASAINLHVHEDIVSQIKAKATTWTPVEVENNIFKDWTSEEIKRMLSLVPDAVDANQIPPREPVTASYPAAFDSRTQWPNCIHPIRDQQRCGSCWAFAGSEAFSDRLCIAGGPNVVMSPEDMVECDNWNNGCNGGNLWFAWRGLVSRGLATDECVPYTSGDGKVPTCSSKCADGSVKKRYKCNSYFYNKGEDIKGKLMESGPMETGFSVYEDFMNYGGGIYTHTTGSFLGGHAVKIIGWGTENGTEYWIVANSWGTSWGEKGFFRIARGQVGIEDCAYGCVPFTTAQAVFETTA